MSEAYQQIPIEKLEPNTWNPNVLQPELMAKLENGIREVYDKHGRIPPIFARPHPTHKGKFEIIDGFHRWTICKKLKMQAVDTFVLPVDDSMARILTATLNYVRGEADPAKYAVAIAETIQKNPDLKLADLAKLLPQTEDQLLELVESSGTALEKLAAVMDEREKEDKGEEGKAEDEDRWVNLNLTLPMEVAAMLDHEIERIADCLDGKQRRIRAIEYIVINSALTPLDGVKSQVALKEKQRERKEARQVNLPQASAAPVATATTNVKKSAKPTTPPKKKAKVN